MKKLALSVRLFIISLLFVPFAAQADHSLPDLLKDVSAAIKTGSAKELSKFIGKSIEIKMGGDEASYSKAQAEQVIRDFFKKNPPKSFKLVHSGTSREGAKYGIGTLNTTNGKTYRTYIYIKESKGRKYIEELRFEAQ